MKTFSFRKELPTITNLGFTVIPAPHSLKLIIEEVKEFTSEGCIPESMPYYISNAQGTTASSLSELHEKPELRQRILDEFATIFQSWAQTPLKPAFVYGARTYHRGATLAPHVDRIETHHVGAVVCVDIDVEEDWPLEICAHDGTWHNVILHPGDVLLYESAACMHGRSTPLIGDHYTSFFVHFSFKNLEYLEP